MYIYTCVVFNYAVTGGKLYIRVVMLYDSYMYHFFIRLSFPAPVHIHIALLQVLILLGVQCF